MKKRLIIAGSVLAVILIGVLVINFSKPKDNPSTQPQSDAEVVLAEEINSETVIDTVSDESSATVEVDKHESSTPAKTKQTVKKTSQPAKTEVVVVIDEPIVTEIPEVEPSQQVTETPKTVEHGEVAEQVEQVEQVEQIEQVESAQPIVLPTPDAYQEPKVEIAKEVSKHKAEKAKRVVKYPINKSFIHNIAIIAGTDIGAAAPWPLSHLLSSGDKFYGTPRITPTVGLRYVLPVSQIWSFGINVIYKKVCFDAITRVTNQRYYDADTEFLQYFSGTAQATMEFAMWEIPAYAKYTFPYSNHSILIGGYAAWRPKSSFESVAKKGYVGGAPDICDGIVDSDLQMSFTKSLREFELGVMAGYEYKISRHFGIGARLYVGMTDIFIPAKRSLSYKMIPIRGSFLLSYQIFSKKDTPNK